MIVLPRRDTSFITRFASGDEEVTKLYTIEDLFSSNFYSTNDYGIVECCSLEKRQYAANSRSSVLAV